MNDHDTLGPEGSYYEAKAKEEERARRRKSDAMYPLLITALYLVLGAMFDLWHPGWLVFFTIPLHYIHFNSKLEMITNPIVVVLLYLVLGFFFHLWHPGWLIFLAIPFGGIANNKR